MSPVVLPAALAAASVASWVLVPRSAELRLRSLGRRPLPAPSARAPARLLLVLVPALLVMTLGIVAAVLGAAAAALVLRLRTQRAARTARHEERTRAVEACGALAGELRAGRSAADALAAAAEVAAGPSRTSLTAAASAARLGGDVPAALHPPPGCAVAPVLHALAACWSVCSGSGSGLASAVERLEEGLRAAQDQGRAVDAELAGPRATAGLLAVLPAAGLLLASGLGADPLHVLLHTPVGLGCLAGGLGLDGLGLWWTGRLVARAGGSG